MELDQVFSLLNKQCLSLSLNQLIHMELQVDTVDISNLIHMVVCHPKILILEVFHPKILMLDNNSPLHNKLPLMSHLPTLTQRVSQ